MHLTELEFQRDRGELVALAPSADAHDLVDVIPWEERYRPTSYVPRIHRDQLEAFGLKQAFDEAQVEGVFVRARWKLEVEA